MSYLVGFAVLIGYAMLGQWLAVQTNQMLPGPLIGLLLLLVTLLVMGRIPSSLDRGSRVLLGHMSVLFIPATLSIVVLADKLAEHLWVIAISLVITTLVSLGLTAWISQYMLQRAKKATVGDHNVD